MAADEACLLHQVRRADRLRPEAQVRHGLRARLLRVVDEVPLRVQVLLGAEDLDRVLVRADRAVRAEAEEDRADRAGRLDVQRRVVRQAQAGHVVVDADREPGPRPLAGEFREHAGHHARGELLRRQAVTPARHQRQHRALTAGVRLGQRGDHVEEQRLAVRAGFLGPVEHGDPADAGRQGVEQRLHRERPVQPDLQHAHPLALAAQVGHGLADGLGRRAHHDDHPLSLRVSGVIHDVILAAGAGGQAAHRVLNRARHGGAERVQRLHRVEVDVRVLRGAPDERSLRRQRPAAMRADQRLGHERAQVVVGKQLDRVQLVRGAEPVEEVHERHPGRQRGRLRYQREVVGLLDRSGGEQREPGLPHRHHVRVVTEDGQALRGQRPGRDV